MLPELCRDYLSIFIYTFLPASALGREDERTCLADLRNLLGTALNMV